METIVLGVEPRTAKKNEAGKLRKNGQVPAIVYHKGEETVAISVSELELTRLVHTPESHIINLHFPDGRLRRSFIKEVQFHPVTDRIIHTDFQLFSADEVIELDVPVTASGNSIGIEKGGKLMMNRHSLTLKGKPDRIPDHLVIDITNLDVAQVIHIRDIPQSILDGLEVVGDPDTPVITILSNRKESGTEEGEAAAEA